MPKASFARKDAVEVSMGIQEGFIEVVGAITKMHQYPPNKGTGEQGNPFCCVQLEVVRLDDKGERIDDTPINEEFSVGGTDDKNPGNYKFHPGKAANATDDDPEDMGTEVDVEGNCLYVEEGGKLNKKCKWIIFSDSLEEKGFKADVLANGYMPELIGLKCHVKTVVVPKSGRMTKDGERLVVDKVLVFPYDVKKAAKKAPAPAKAAAKPAPPAVPPPTATTAVTDAGDDPEQIALFKLFALTTDPEFAGKESVERKKIQTTIQTKLMRERVPTKLHKPVMDLVKSDEWLTAQTTENEDSPIYGKLMLNDDGTATFIAE